MFSFKNLIITEEIRHHPKSCLEARVTLSFLLEGTNNNTLPC